MKRFVVRSIGWVFDDDWYNYDGEYDVEGVYLSRKDAVQRRNYLNHKRFLDFFSYLSRFQIDYDYHLNNTPKFVDVKRIAVLMAKRLELKEEDLFDNRYNRLNDDKNIKEKITTDLVDEVLTDNHFTFYKIIEFNTEDIYFNYFKRNPIVWNKFYNETEYGEEDYYYYFYDDRDADIKRAVGSIKECYEYAIKHPYSSILYTLLNKKLIQGEFSALSETPNILKSIIDESSNIEYDTTNESVLFKQGISIEELMALDAVLINPIILIEKVKVESLKRAN